MKIRSAVLAQRDPMNKKGRPHDEKHVVTKHDDFPITFASRFYNSLYYRTSRDDLRVSLSLFAGDLKLYTVYELDATHNDLQVAVNRLANWASLWQLQIAIDNKMPYFPYI